MSLALKRRSSEPYNLSVPCDGLVLLVICFFLDIHTPRTPFLAGLLAIDWLGLIASVSGVVVFLMGLEYGGVSLPWSSATVICLLAFGAVLMVAFFLIEWRVAKYPMMTLRLFNSRSNAFTFATRFSHGFTFISASYFLPLYFQAVLDCTPFEAGLKQLAYILGTSVPGVLVGVIIRRTGDFKTPIVAGMLLMALGFGLFLDLPSYLDYRRIFPAQLVAGIGTGPNFQAPLIALQAHSEPADIAPISGTYAFIGQCGCAISLVVGGAILQNRLSSYTSVLSKTLNKSEIAQIAGGAAGSSVRAIQSLPQPAKNIVQDIFNESMQTMWIFYTVIATCGFGFSLFIKKRTLSTAHTVRKQGLDTEERARLERLAKPN
jgi:Fungal trichothecene efflux pump (TRI12)